MNTLPVRSGFYRTSTSIAIPRLFLLIVTVAVFTVASIAQEIQKIDPALDQLVGPDAKLERIAMQRRPRGLTGRDGLHQLCAELS